MTPREPYFCRSSQDDRETPCFANVDDAVKEAEKMNLAPFVILQLVPQPIGHRVTNGRQKFEPFKAPYG